MLRMLAMNKTIAKPTSPAISATAMASARLLEDGRRLAAGVCMGYQVHSSEIR
jgi:hypothetical protein